MQSYFENLGALVEKDWEAKGRTEDQFSDIAAAALDSHPPSEQVDLDSLIDHLLDPHRQVPPQLAPLGVFGQPGVTVYHGQDFVVDVYFWTQSLSAIHNHPFCGAFTLLKGFSVHARYRWQEHEQITTRMRFGELALERLERVNPGNIGTFGHQHHSLVHALLHVPIPSISMVVRTIRTEGYLRYFPPGIAMAMESPGDVYERPIMLLDTLSMAGNPDFPARFRAFLRDVELEIVFRALSRMWFGWSDAEKEHWINVVRRPHGNRVDAIAAALNEAQRSYDAEILRDRLAGADDRFIATGLMLADRRKTLLDLVSQQHPDPLARLHRFADTGGVFTTEEEVPALLAHALIDGESPEGALARVVNVFGEEAVSGQEDGIRAYCATGAFAPLQR